MKKLLLIVALAVLANASETFYYPSFSCDTVKPGSVEWEICTNKPLSLMDMKLSNLYKEVRQLNPKVKITQLQWLKERNRCREIACIKGRYEQRYAALIEEKVIIKGNTKGYPILTMSKDDEMCRHFYQLFYDDMHRYDGYMPHLHKEFSDVPWEQADVSSAWHLMGEVKTAQIDINNNGKKEFVLFRDYSAFSGKYWYETIESIRWYDLSKKELLKGKIEEQNELMKQLGDPMYFVQTFQTSLKLTELPPRSKEMLFGELSTYYSSAILDYQGIRIAKYKERYYLVFFGLNKFIDYDPKSQIDKKSKIKL